MNRSPEAKPFCVVKIGGGLIGQLDIFWREVRALQGTRRVVLVHGGGPQATAMARRLGHQPTIVQGRRVTSDLDLDIVRWTMRGEINVTLAAAAQAAGIPAVGLSGADAGILRVTRRPPRYVDGKLVDFGWVGDVQGVDTGFLTVSLGAGLMPIVAPLGIDTDGQVYNVNADTVAAAIAQEFPAAELLLATGTGGLRTGPGPDAERIPVCGGDLYDAGIRDGWITAGMRVKLQLGFEALAAGVGEVWVTGVEDLVGRRDGTRLV
jgi:acetylglutamate kinase